MGRIVLVILTFILIGVGLYQIFIKNDSGLGRTSFAFSVLVFLLSLIPVKMENTTTQATLKISNEETGNAKELETEYDENREIYDRALAFYKADEIELSISELMKIDKDSLYYNESRDLLDNAIVKYQDNILAGAEELAGRGEFEQAITVIDKAIIFLQKSTLLEAKREEYKTKFIESILSEAKNAAETENNEKAIYIIQEGLSVFPEENSLLTALEEYKIIPPVYLADMEAYEQNDISFDSNNWFSTDNYGNVYNTDRVIYSSNLGSDSGLISYYLDGKYNFLNGTLYVCSESRDIKEPGDSIFNSITKFQIYGDDVLLYEYLDLKYKDKPINFEVNIEGVDFLTITIYGSYYKSWYIAPYICVADLSVKQ